MLRAPALLALLCALTAACSPSNRAADLNSQELPPMPPLPPEDPEDMEEPTAGGEQEAAAAPAAEPGGEAPAAVPTSAPAPELPPLPGSLDGGEIPRSELFAVLADGIGHFLRKVRTEPHLTGGRFVGWRLLTLPVEEGALRLGDTVLRVNGQSIERPEQFKNVWDSMATSSELVLDVRRAGKDGKVRFKIVD
ncbi:MAG: hypothetical protein OXT09_12655 [Myxococcales bacterium]|nr:hypothetical protein [Myxococcales bacterium]